MPEVPLPHGAGTGVPPGAPGAPGAPLPASMEGLANQGMGLGPPNNLHDRVVFVSNVSGTAGGLCPTFRIRFTWPRIELTRCFSFP
jgi:hypothetical protein